MLTHGRLIVTQNGLMLDEVRSLLQKALRRLETDLAFRATKELIGPNKDQLPWKSIVTFMYEDHCLNHVDVFSKLYRLYEQKNKHACIALIARCYTCRYAACRQVVALDNIVSLHVQEDLPLNPSLVGLVSKETRGINIDLLVAHIVKKWQENDVLQLRQLFALINMAAKGEKCTVSAKGKMYLLSNGVKKPTIFHVVLSILYKHTTDEYMKSFVMVCYKFAAIGDVPESLILFSVLTKCIYKENYVENLGSVMEKEQQKVDWNGTQRLESMPSWAVDKHTFRGKFGKASIKIYLKKFKNEHKFTDTELEEFHGERPKATLQSFFDEGAICHKDILPDNDIWEATKAMYFKHKPSLQKCAKMTKACYEELREHKFAMFDRSSPGSMKETSKKCKKRKVEIGVDTCKETVTKKKKLSLEHAGSTETPTGSKEKHGKANEKKTKIDEFFGASVYNPRGPLLQLPTGSAKVYTRLDRETNKIWKGPYKTSEKQNLCIFYHRAMKEVFADKHTLDFEKQGKYVAFPLVKSKDATLVTNQRAFYDCISKQDVSESNGEFIERESFGIVQLHKIDPYQVKDIPMSLWAHFGFRFVLNIGDSGLYNAISVDNMREIYGIDMEERRCRVKGDDLMNLMFTKLPKRALVAQIANTIRTRGDELSAILATDFDFQKLKRLHEEYGLEDLSVICQHNLEKLRRAVVKICE